LTESWFVSAVVKVIKCF